MQRGNRKKRQRILSGIIVAIIIVSMVLGMVVSFAYGQELPDYLVVETAAPRDESGEAPSDGEKEKAPEAEDEADRVYDAKLYEDTELDPDYVLPIGIRINGRAMGGMLVSQAEEELKNLKQEVLEGSLTMKIGKKALEIPYEDIDMTVDYEPALKAASQVGAHGNLIQRYKQISDVKFSEVNYTYPYEYNEKKLSARVKQDTESFNCDPQDATLVRRGGEFILTDDVDGCKVNVSKTVKMIRKALEEGWDGSDVSVKVQTKVTKAKHSAKELKNVNQLLGGYDTDYSSSSSNRMFNVEHGCTFIDEVLLYPGETFSFLDHVTPITEANGYLESTGYQGGKVVPSTGGGICQVSSTLYNAVLRAELEVVERYNHGLTVGYVPLGADATVSEGSVDFKFKNNLNDPVYIEAYTWGGNVYTNIYGVETRPSNREIRFYSVTDQTLSPGKDVITEDSSKPKGYEEVTQSAHTGYVASFYKEIYIDGVLQDTLRINQSTYSATPRYITKGTKVVKSEPDDDEDSDDGSDDGNTHDGDSDDGSGDSGSGDSGDGGEDSNEE